MAEWESVDFFAVGDPAGFRNEAELPFHPSLDFLVGSGSAHGETLAYRVHHGAGCDPCEVGRRCYYCHIVLCVFVCDVASFLYPAQRRGRVKAGVHSISTRRGSDRGCKLMILGGCP
jgi:hypothetical protein